MFGESESESPRVPSPWDHLISSRSPSGSPPSFTPRSAHSSPPLNPTTPPDSVRNLQPMSIVQTILPRLVPEAESGNIEYKLQLLSPSPARFARLVTQLKWRLLEGGGQAYYELGVADSGALVGLSRVEMEATLETLEMMAGEIGASVIVVKEIEVPEAMVQKAVEAGAKVHQEKGADVNWVGEEKWRRAKKRRGKEDEDYTTTSTDATDAAATETTDAEAEGNEDGEDLSATVMLDRPLSGSKNGPKDTLRSLSATSSGVFIMDPEESDPVGNDADGEQDPEPDVLSIVLDLEIASVFKPRPVRTKSHSAQLMSLAAKNKRQKMFKPPFTKQQKNREEKVPKGVPAPIDENGAEKDGGSKGGRRPRRQGRDKKRVVQLQAQAGTPDSAFTMLTPLPPAALPGVAEVKVTSGDAEESQPSALVSHLEDLHVSLQLPGNKVKETRVDQICEDLISVGLFTASAGNAEKGVPAVHVVPAEENDEDDVFPTISATLGNDRTNEGKDSEEDGKRIIVEALVVRKMSLEEAFLDFGGAFAN